MRESVCVLQAIKFVLQVLHARLPCMPAFRRQLSCPALAGGQHCSLPAARYIRVCVCEGERKREGEAEKEGWQVVVCLVALL